MWGLLRDRVTGGGACQLAEAALELLETHPGPLVVPTLVITEVVYLLATRLTPAGTRRPVVHETQASRGYVMLHRAGSGRFVISVWTLTP